MASNVRGTTKRLGVVRVMLIYRIESLNNGNRGLYQVSNVSICYTCMGEHTFQAVTHAGHRPAVFGEGERTPNTNKQYRFGFPTICCMKQWICNEWWNRLAYKGEVVISVYDAPPGSFLSTDTQVLFMLDRAKHLFSLQLRPILGAY